MKHRMMPEVISPYRAAYPTLDEGIVKKTVDNQYEYQ